MPVPARRRLTPPRSAELRRVAIVPALNEEATSARVIDELRAFDPGLDVVVIDDGSTDRTAEVAAAHGAHVLRLPFNLGIGGAVQTGFRYAWEHGYDVAVQVDGDGQHDPAQLGAVLAPVLAGEADIAVGSRFAGDARLPLVARAPGRDPRVRLDRLARSCASASPTRRRASRRSTAARIALFAARLPARLSPRSRRR